MEKGIRNTIKKVPYPGESICIVIRSEDTMEKSFGSNLRYKLKFKLKNKAKSTISDDNIEAKLKPKT